MKWFPWYRDLCIHQLDQVEMKKWSCRFNYIFAHNIRFQFTRCEPRWNWISSPSSLMNLTNMKCGILGQFSMDLKSSGANAVLNYSISDCWICSTEISGGLDKQKNTGMLQIVITNIAYLINQVNRSRRMDKLKSEEKGGELWLQEIERVAGIWEH